MTTTTHDSETTWCTSNENETTVVLKKSDVVALLGSNKVLCMQLEKYNKFTEECIAHIKSKGEKLPPGMEIMSLIGKLTVERSREEHKRIMKYLGLTKLFPDDEP